MAAVNAAYREIAVAGTTPVGLVVLLYDRAMEDVRNALAALAANDPEQRSQHINHALLVLQQLQGSLDFRAGGATARQLDRYYSVIRAKLLEAQIRQSRQLLQQQITALSQVRDSWVEVERRESAVAAETPTMPAANTMQEGEHRIEWNA